MQILKRIRIDIFLILLISIAVFLCYQNYTPHTILSGWDTLHPEFNLSQYVTRITSVWQEHQGLGAPPSQAHASEIPRMLIYSVLMVIFPFEFVRYSYIFLMIIMGPVGVYLFLTYLFKKGQVRPQIVQTGAFLGGLFYLLNLGTMQHFIVILEMFATKFGFLGFIYLFTTKFLDTGKRKDFIILLIFIFFSASMAHTATLWYVFYFGLVLYVGIYALLQQKTKREVMRRGMIMLASILVINLYWLLPNLYYSFNYASDILTAKINRLFSEEAYLNNKAYGNIADLFLFRNFLFNWKVLELTLLPENNTFITSTTDLMKYWKVYLENTWVIVLGYFFSLVALAGSVIAIKKKEAPLISLLPITFISSIFLLSNVPLLAQLFDFLRGSSDFFREGLRFPFTKLSLYLIFSFSVFFGYAHIVLLRRFARNLSPIIIGMYLCFFAGIIITYAWPAFNGNFISKVIRVEIPQEYYDLFAWSQEAKKGRMLELPMHSLYGWTTYQWENQQKNSLYQGAGFTWFGLKQPLLNREFDRWYPYNEQSYRELSYALYSQNPVLFEELLRKYNITYLLVDENIFNAGTENEQKQLFFSGIDELTPKVQNLHLVKQFGSNIKVYEYLPSQVQDSVFILNNSSNILPVYRWGYLDQAYRDYGDYISSETLSSDRFQTVLYPTRNILTDKERIDTSILTFNPASYNLSLLQQESLRVPDILSTEKEIFTDIYVQKRNNNIIILLDYLLPREANESNTFQEFILSDRANDPSVIFAINDKVVTVVQNQLTAEPTFVGETIISTEKTNTVVAYDKKSTTLPVNLTRLFPYACSEQKGNQIYSGEVLQSNSFAIEGKGVKVCNDIKITDIFEKNRLQKEGLLNVQLLYTIPKNIDSEMCLYNKAENTCSQGTHFPSFIDTTGQINQLLPLSRQNLDELFFRFSLDARETDNLKKLVVSDLKAAFYQEAQSVTFLPKIPRINDSIDKSSSLIGKLPQKQIDVTTGHMSKDVKDCGLNPAKFLDKTFRDGFVEYTSIQGTLCDVFSFQDLSKQNGYIVAINSKNIGGLPLRICMQDELTKKCFIEDELSKNTEFGLDYFVLPPYNGQQGYHVVLTSISIGSLPSVNQLKKISIIPFPYNFFQGFQTNKNSNRESTERTRVSYVQNAPYYYKVTLDGQIDDNNEVIVLDQAYEKNWKAYIVDGWLSQLFPMIFGRELKEHVMVNNWANGWGIDKEISSEDKKPVTIAIIFLPQLLQYLGFILLVVPFIYAFWLRKKKE